MKGTSDKSCNSTSDVRKEKIILTLIILSPVILTIILSIIGDIDARRTQEKLNSHPTVTWRDVLTPEERKKFGLDRHEEMERNLKSGSSGKPARHISGSSKSETDFDKQDFYDILDYNGGLDGEYSDIDYHDIEDIYGD